jgi:hypothetical protein
MQVLRVGGEHLATRQQNARKALMIIAIVGVLGAGALSILVHPSAGVLLGVMCVPAGVKARAYLRRVAKGIKGEVLVSELLQALPDDYFLLNDVVLKGHPGNIDHVVVGPCGVVVIETKNLSGSVETHWNAWFVGGWQHRSISKQVNRGAIAVRQALSRAHPDLEKSVLRFVDSVVVFTNPVSRVKVDRAQTIVARYSELLDVIHAIAQRKRVPAAIAARLAESLRKLMSSEAAA